jgi:DNA invertase Pin-like site-specific DNA recombinase
MTNADLLPAAVLKRKAVVYVRQSTQAQVQTNLESQRRQYELVDEARRRGFQNVEVIDDDLGRSASGMTARPGFDRLVAWLCAGEVGAVLCFDASRLARNGRDWHHLLELCGLVEARVIDLDGVYDPCRPNDRLLLGMKGSISEFELGVLRARMLDAARAKARRGELRIPVPVGYIWHREIGLGLDPDLRLQEAIRLVFTRFRELGSARQVLLSMKADQIHFPRPSDGKRMVAFDWTPIRYRNVISVLKNPFYAGAYAYGKSEKRTAINRWTSFQDLRPWQAFRRVGGHAQRAPRRLYRLGRVRTEPKTTGGQYLRLDRRYQVRPGRRRFWPVFSPADIVGAG